MGVMVDFNMEKIIMLSLLIFSANMFGQNVQTEKTVAYSFIVQDTPSQLFTMRQFNQSYLSTYRLLARGLNSVTKKRYISDLIQIGLHSFFFMPLTHEEGHRSILTVNYVGSISQPFFNESGAAYVNGVTDQTLMDLRDNDLPTYIRLHTGGLESDYMLTKHVESIGSFDLDDFNHYKWEYWLRKGAILQYFILGLFEFEIDIKEESNELERDIVGFDTYGAVRHLFRPTMNFYRYTRHEDLTVEEKKYVNRLGYRSLLNLLNPLMLGKGGFKLNEKTTMNVGLGYMMSPFGDFIDENIWLKSGLFNFLFYARQFQNKENWFHGIGISLVDYQLSKKLIVSVTSHYWQQPINYDFHTSESFTGGAVDANLKYFFFNNQNGWLNGFSVDFGLVYKTEGFLPEELYLDKHFGFRFGTTIKLD